MAPRCDLDVDMLGHNLRLGHVWDDGVDLSQGLLAELEEEWGLVGQFDFVQHVTEQDPGNFHTSRQVANNLRCIQVFYPGDGDQRGAQVEVQMALDTPSEVRAVAQGSVPSQCCSQLGKPLEIFCVQPHPVCVGGKECEKC
jgi:hypothetical protein